MKKSKTTHIEPQILANNRVEDKTTKKKYLD